MLMEVNSGQYQSWGSAPLFLAALQKHLMQFLVHEIHPFNQRNGSATEMTKEEDTGAQDRASVNSTVKKEAGQGRNPQTRRTGSCSRRGWQVSRRVTGEGRTSMESGHWTRARQSRATAPAGWVTLLGRPSRTQHHRAWHLHSRHGFLLPSRGSRPLSVCRSLSGPP